MSLKIAIAQINATVGDFAGNRARILDFAERARQQGADLLLTPELALCGYPTRRPAAARRLLRACERELAGAGRRVAGIAVLVGHPEKRDGRTATTPRRCSAAARVATYYKQRLPSYEVFDEERYFDSGDAACVLTLNGHALRRQHLRRRLGSRRRRSGAREAGAGVLLVLNASPYHIGKRERRTEVLRQRIASTGLPVVYANLAGGQDELVFDGGSFVLDSRGTLCCQLPQFEEALGIVDFVGGEPQPTTIVAAPCQEAEVYQALVLGVRDYLGKNGFPGAIIGLSGGIDSALTLCIAVDALGADKVRAVMMPSPYTAELSLSEVPRDGAPARRPLRRNRHRPAMLTLAGMLEKQFAGLPADTTEENLQARIRGMILMALSNKTGSLVLTTGNKSEMAVGYCTLYGDMAGGFAVIKDIAKTLVYRLSRWRNTRSYVIPERIISRPPSAELRPDQTDQDSLPPYECSTPSSRRTWKRTSARARSLPGFAEADVRRVVHLLKISEYKRRQAPGRNPGHAARFRQGLALSDHQSLP
jgi:NAD+ synthetase